MRRLRPAAVLVAAALAVTGCASLSDNAYVSSSSALLDPLPTPTPAQPAAAPPRDCKPFRSLRPMATPRVTAGSFMAKIRERGQLRVGVDQNTLPLSYFNPTTGKLEGFEIDLLNAVAEAIFGPGTNRIEFTAISTAQRLDVVRDGTVDIVADAIAITCDRRRKVSFTAPYYLGGHSVMVLRDSPVQTLDDVAGKQVCADRGSISVGYIRKYLHAVPYLVDLRTDCLVALQQGRVGAISTPWTFLLGYHRQDPLTRLVEERYVRDPVGMAIDNSHPEFVSFVNAVLERVHRNRTWANSYRRWFRGLALGRQLDPPKAEYRDR